MIVNRIINFLNPSTPKGELESLVVEAESDHGPAWLNARDMEEALSWRLDLADLIPLTQEDYYLDLDVDHHFPVDLSKKSLFKITDARVCGPLGDVISPDNRLLTEFTPHNKSGSIHNAFRRRRFGKTNKLPGRSFNLATPFSQNYYHWVIEALPRLRFLEGAIDTIDWFLVPKQFDFHARTLQLAGIEKSKIISIDVHEQFHCSELLTANFQKCFAADPNSIKWLRKKFWGIDGAETEAVDKVYISRKDASWRYIDNEAEVSDFLKPYGYKSVSLSELDFLEQVHLFENATHVISAHGAGLANLAFCKPGTKVLEIYPPRWTSVAYAHLSKLCDLEYRYCNAEPLGIPASEIEKYKRHIPHLEGSQSAAIQLPLEKLKLFCEQCP